MSSVSAIETLRNALFGNPPKAGFEPSREGVVRAFEELTDIINVSGTTLVYDTKAHLDAAPGTTIGARAEVRADGAGDVTNGNGVYQWSGSAWVWISPLLPLSAASAAELARDEALSRVAWLDPDVLTGDLSDGAGWTDNNEAVARAIKAVRVEGADPDDQYYIGIFENHAGTDDVFAIYRASDGDAVSSITATIDKLTDGLTEVVVSEYSGSGVKVTLWVDYRDLSGFTGTLINSASTGPLWIARTSAASFVDARLALIENDLNTARNIAINGPLDPSRTAPIVAGLIPGHSLVYNDPVADIAAKGVIQSLPVGPEAVDILFFYMVQPLDGNDANKYFFASQYVYCSNVGDFPTGLQGIPDAGSTLLASAVTGDGYEQVSTNVRFYWITGQLPNNMNMTAFLYGQGALAAHTSEVGGFTFATSNTPLTLDDVRRDDWDGEFLADSALVALSQSISDFQSYPEEWTPYVTSAGHLNIKNDVSDVRLATKVGTMRGVQQTASHIRWVDDGLTTRGDFDFEALAGLIGLGVSRIVFKPMIGQSLATGVFGTSLITTTTPHPGRAFMFNGGTRVTQGSLFDNLHVVDLADAQMLRLIPLIEQLPPSGIDFGETQGGGEAWWLGNGGVMASDTVFVFATFAFGGLTIAQISSGTVPYRNLIRGVERLYRMCQLAGITLEIPAVDFEQGQADYSTAGGTYGTALSAIQASLTTDINAITGGSGQIPLMLRQPTSWTANATGYNLTESAAMLAMVDTALANPTKFRLAGPQYSHDNYAGDGIHMVAAGYRREGEYRGRSTARLRAAQSAEGLVMTGIANVGATVTITFNAATQIAIDTTLVTDPGQKGIRLLNNVGTSLTLTGIATSGTNKIVATAPGALTAGQTYTVGVADVGTIGQPAGPTTGARSNIRDTSTDAASSGANLYNWAHAQRKTFVAA